MRTTIHYAMKALWQHWLWSLNFRKKHQFLRNTSLGQEKLCYPNSCSEYLDYEDSFTHPILFFNLPQVTLGPVLSITFKWGYFHRLYRCLIPILRLVKVRQNRKQNGALQILPKNKETNLFVFLLFYSSQQKNKQIHSIFFGRIYSAPICSQFYLTFTDSS